MSTNSRVVTAVSSLIQTLMPLMPADFFNNNQATTVPLNLSTNVSSISSEGLISPMATNNISESTTTNVPDPIYSLFGQPDGVLCKAILDSLSFYDKSSIISSLTTDSSIVNSNTSIEVLTNCLMMLKSAASNNPQYIDRIMGPFMKILQKLYRDHLNATGALATSVVTQVPASSTSLENSKQMFKFKRNFV